MTREEILHIPSMPPASPSYPFGPYRFINREYMIITYESDPDAVRHALPEPLEPLASPLVAYEFIRMPDSSGFGDYTETGVVIPCTYNGEPVNFTAQMYLDDEPPIAGGREVWGFPKKHAEPKFTVVHDTIIGTLHYDGAIAAQATMVYKHERHAADIEETAKAMTKTNVNLKLIPHVDGTLAIAQLVAYNLTEIEVLGAWTGAARLHLVPHVNAPVADLPVRKILGGKHFIANLTLPYGRVLHDYLK